MPPPERNGTGKPADVHGHRQGMQTDVPRVPAPFWVRSRFSAHLFFCLQCGAAQQSRTPQVRGTL